jgi:hypothetical protein
MIWYGFAHRKHIQIDDVDFECTLCHASTMKISTKESRDIGL